MEIIQHNSAHLIIKHNYPLPTLKEKIVVFTISILPLLPFYMVIPKQQKLNCDRLEPKQVICTVQEKAFFQKDEILSIQLKKVTIVQETRSEGEGEKDYQVYQIQLHSKTGVNNFGYATRNGTEIGEMANQINSFLANSNQRNFQVTQQSNSWWTVAGFFLSGGIWFSIFMKLGFWRAFDPILNETWDFDKTQNKLVIHKFFSHNRRTETEYLFLAQSWLEIISQKDSDDNNIYSFNLQLEPGKYVTLLKCVNDTKREKEAEELFELIGNHLDWNRSKSIENRKARYR
jgi:hypothetical protein